jgi:hypothetical protein
MNHIKNTFDEKSWCNKQITTDFCFKDIEQAAINGVHGSRAICGECVDTIIKCLETNGKQYYDESNTNEPGCTERVNT